METLRAEFAGPDSSYYGDNPEWLIVYATHRDSEAIERSNATEIQDRLSKVGEENEDWAIEGFGHWAVGHGEYIIVRPGTNAQTEAELIQSELADYPVLNEDAYSDLEHEEAFESCLSEVRYRIGGRLGNSQNVDDINEIASNVMTIDMDMGADTYEYWPSDKAIAFGYLQYLREHVKQPSGSYESVTVGFNGDKHYRRRGIGYTIR